MAKMKFNLIIQATEDVTRPQDVGKINLWMAEAPKF